MNTMTILLLFAALSQVVVEGHAFMCCLFFLVLDAKHGWHRSLSFPAPTSIFGAAGIQSDKCVRCGHHREAYQLWVAPPQEPATCESQGIPHGLRRHAPHCRQPPPQRGAGNTGHTNAHSLECIIR